MMDELSLSMHCQTFGAALYVDSSRLEFLESNSKMLDSSIPPDGAVVVLSV